MPGSSLNPRQGAKAELSPLSCFCHSVPSSSESLCFCLRLLVPRESSLHGWGWKPPLEGYVFLIASPHIPSSWAHSLLSPNRYLAFESLGHPVLDSALPDYRPPGWAGLSGFPTSSLTLLSLLTPTLAQRLDSGRHVNAWQHWIASETPWQPHLIPCCCRRRN